MPRLRLSPQERGCGNRTIPCPLGCIGISGTSRRRLRASSRNLCWNTGSTRVQEFGTIRVANILGGPSGADTVVPMKAKRVGFVAGEFLQMPISVDLFLENMGGEAAWTLFHMRCHRGMCPTACGPKGCDPPMPPRELLLRLFYFAVRRCQPG